MGAVNERGYTTAIHYGVNGEYKLGLCTKPTEHTTAYFNKLKVKHIDEVFDIGNCTTIGNDDLIKVTHTTRVKTRVKIFKLIESGEPDTISFKSKIIYIGEE